MDPAEPIRQDFPALEAAPGEAPLVYLDSAATTLTPRPVIEAVAESLARDVGNAHRAVHGPCARATARLEAARARVAEFLGAASADEVVLMAGATAALNLVAQGWASPRLAPGDEILVTELEHHSNLIPWRWACKRSGATLRVAPMDADGGLRADSIEQLLSSRTRVVALTHVSNVLGSLLPVAEIAARAHAVGARVVVDGAQAVAHLDVDVHALDADFYAFSAHKAYGPRGVGVLWGRAELLEEMHPIVGGGGMVRAVGPSAIELSPPPRRFEAGTANVAAAAGMHSALDYLQGQAPRAARQHERALMEYAAARLSDADGIRVLGSPPERLGVLSFVVDGVHPHDLGTLLDAESIAVRTGHHCASPLMARLGVPATVRLSVGLYNTRSEIDALVEATQRARRKLT